MSSLSSLISPASPSPDAGGRLRASTDVPKATAYPTWGPVVAASGTATLPAFGAGAGRRPVSDVAVLRTAAAAPSPAAAVRVPSFAWETGLRVEQERTPRPNRTRDSAPRRMGYLIPTSLEG